MPTYVTSTVAAPMPNLENLKKQAKLVLRWHRDRYYPVIAPVRGRRYIDRAGPADLGRSQVVRQRILIPPFPGSSPGAPASQSRLCGGHLVHGNTRDIS